MKPIIGVVGRFEKISEVNNAIVLYENVVKAINASGGNVVGIPYYDESLIDICDGIVLEGGDDNNIEDFKFIKYCYQKGLTVKFDNHFFA